MNLYNIFEGLENTKDNKSVPTDQKQTDYANTTADMAKGELVNKLPRMLPTDRKDPMMGMQEEGVTEDSQEVIDEVAMNPSVFAQAIKTGQEKGVLVGFEFETCIPKTSIERWKTGDQTQDPEVPRYDAESTAWVDGKTTDDLIQGIIDKSNGNFGHVMDDLFKYKGSVATQMGSKNPWNHYIRWADQRIRARLEGEDAVKLIFTKLAEFLKDPEIKAMEVSYMSDQAVRDYGPPENWNGRTFTIEFMKRETGVDFGKRVPKSALTAELAQKVREACHRAYTITRNPYDSRINRVGNALDSLRSDTEAEYYPTGYRRENTPERMALIKQHFAEFNQETMGTTDLKELLMKKWAFRGRVNNATPVLKEKLWYYVTPNAPIPTSLAPRSYGRSSYNDGAEFLKANLKDVFGENMTIFTGYHQATKQLDRWYIEPDGSLRANGDDSTAEVVSPPLPAAQAMTALRTWYEKAEQLRLYTNSSTGLHINVSIPGNLDVLKLATFVGDQYVLKQFGRQDNSYARSVIKSLKGQGNLPTVGSTEFKDAEREMKEIVKRISGDHFATVNFNGKYVSFRHAGGNYLAKAQDIANTVGRFVRAMIIASDPSAYRDEYVAKLVKLMKTPGGDNTEKMALSDIRQLAQKGIPTVKLDVVVRPRDPSNPTQQDIEDALTSIRRWARDQYSLDAVIERDDGARGRLMNDRGFASSSKEWIEQAPDEMFYQATVIPNTRRKLESFADTYSTYGNNRGAAFSLYYDGKRATAIKSNELIKQDNPKFVEVIQALRGGASKPLPLPGAKGTPSTAAATFASQRPAQQEPERTDVQRNGQRRDWIIYNPERPDVPLTTADNMNTTEIVQRVHEIEAAYRFPRGTLRVRYADEPQNTEWGIWSGSQSGFVRDRNSDNNHITFPTEQEAADYIRSQGWNERFNYPQPINQPPTGASGEEGIQYRIVDANGRVDSHHVRFDSLEDAMNRAERLAQSHQIDMHIINAATGRRLETVQYDPNRSQAQDGEQSESRFYQFVNPEDRNVIGSYRLPNDFAARHYAQRLANQVGGTILITADGDEVDTIEPEQSNQGIYRPLANDDQEQTYNIINTTDGDQIQHYHGTLADARRIAQARANQMGVTIGVEDQDGDAFGYFDPQTQNEGITSPGGSDNNDSTSPIHGNEADYDDNYQAMVARVGQKAREQERKKPVDLDKLAQRLRQADKTEITDEDIMESRLYAMKRAGYDIL